MDALTHAVEAFIGQSTTPKTRRCALEASKLIFENLEEVYNNGQNKVARKNMLKAAYLAGVAFTKYNTCPIFVTFEKKESISASTKYVEGFISDSEFSWMTRSNVRMDSSETTALRNFKETDLRIPLFLKKSDAEGSDFYYLGDTEPETDKFVQTTIQNDKGKDLPIMNIPLKLKIPVNENLYRYIMMSPEEATETGTENGSGQA